MAYELGKIGIHAKVTFGLAGERHRREPVELPAVQMAQAADLGVIINIAATPVAAGARIGAQVDQAEWPACRAEENPPRPRRRATARLHPVHRRFFRGHAHARQGERHQNE